MANNGVLQGQPLWNEIAHLRETDEACLAPGFRAAIDVGLIRCNGWDLYPGGSAYNAEWHNGLVKAMKAGGLLSYGGDWINFKDYPHWQWGKCKPTPSDEAVRLYMAAGKQAVWAAVGAL